MTLISCFKIDDGDMIAGEWPEAMTFEPTMEEFANLTNLLTYMESKVVLVFKIVVIATKGGGHFANLRGFFSSFAGEVAFCLLL